MIGTWRHLALAVIMLSAGWMGALILPGGEGWQLQTSFEHDRIMSMDVNGANQSSPDIMLSGSVVFAVWADDRNGSWDIVSRTSKDAGASFGPEVRVDDADRNAKGYDDMSDAIRPRAAIGSDGKIFVVWVDNREGRDLIYLGVSMDTGGNFSASHMLSDTVSGKQENPDIVCREDEAYIVWEDTKNSQHQIYWTRTSDGVNFDSAVRVSDPPSSVMCLDPAIACTRDGIHVVWSDDRTYDQDIYLSNSFDGGATWSASLLVSRDPSSSDQNKPEIVANKTSLFCLFTDLRYNSADVFMAVSRDAGSTMDKEFLLNSENSKGSQTGVRASINDKDNISVAWMSSPGFYDGRSDIQAIVVMPNGSVGRIATVNDPVSQISQSEPGCVMSDAGIVHAVWIDNRRPKVAGSSLTQKDVFYTRSTSSGEEGKAPVIDEVKVSPEVGKVGDRFTFTARYSDVEGDPPVGGAPLLHLWFKSGGSKLYYYPGAPYVMSKNLIPPPDMDYRNGERYIISLTVEKGLDLYYQIGAQAESGNQTEVRTPLEHLPMIDITPPTFAKIVPKDKVWSGTNLVEFIMKMTDMQSGVDPSAIGFRTYRPSQGGWTTWQSRGTYTTDGNGSFIFRGNVTFDDGDENRIVFRAKDMVGNGGKDYPYAQSQEYSVWVDTHGPVVSIESPRSGSILGTPLVKIEARVVDLESGVVEDTLEVSYKLEGSSTYSTWFNLSQFENSEVVQIKDGYYITFEIPLTYGTFNFVRIRSRDALENQGASGEVQLVIRKDKPVVVDMPPSAVSSIQPRIIGSMFPHITWATSVDPEGAPVSYKFRILMAGSNEPFVDWIEIPAGTTYWDPPENMDFTAGTDYTIEIIPLANKLEGPLTRSVLTISLDANRPPGKVQDMLPKATGETRPVLRWTPSVDPEGGEVYYFLRIWKESTGAVLVQWTTVVNGNAYKVPVDLMMGVYTVNILCSDGTDFSPMSSFLLSLGVFSPKVVPERYVVVVYLGTSASINLTVENDGYLFDTITLVMSGSALADQGLELILGKSSVDLVAGGVINVTLSVRVAEFAKVGFRSLNITVRSGDGVTAYSKSLSVRVVDPKNIIENPEKPEGSGGNPDTSWVIYGIVIVLIILIAGMALAFILMERRQREEQVEIIRDHLPDRKHDKLKGKEGKKHLPPRR